MIYYNNIPMIDVLTYKRYKFKDDISYTIIKQEGNSLLSIANMDNKYYVVYSNNSKRISQVVRCVNYEEIAQNVCTKIWEYLLEYEDVREAYKRLAIDECVDDRSVAFWW